MIPDFKEYREPFLGGGSVFVYMKQRYPNKVYWVNDLYENLFHFWTQCQGNITALIKQVYEWREEFEVGKDLHRYLLENIDGFNNLKKAAAFFVFNRITFSGTTESGGFSNGAFNGRFTVSSIERVKRLSNILNDTNITNLDYKTVVEAEGKDVFIFLDPPYFSATKSALYGKNGNYHKYFDHERFAETMKSCKHKWLITYDNCEYIKNLFDFAYIYEWDLTYGMRNVIKGASQVGKELFITNYITENPIAKQSSLFEEVVG